MKAGATVSGSQQAEQERVQAAGLSCLSSGALAKTEQEP